MKTVFLTLIISLCVLTGCNRVDTPSADTQFAKQALPDSKVPVNPSSKPTARETLPDGPFVDTPSRGNLPNVDSSESLDKLIRRLEEPWQLRETGKAYWIGYTNDMYSIAAHGEDVIEPLLDFIKTTKSGYARYGAVFALHLVGIESKVAGRFHEEFKSKKAHKALLSLLDREELQVQVLGLLIRDPWISDMPQLLAILEKGTLNEWAFVKALQRYEVDSPPVHQKLPDDLACILCSCEVETGENYHRKLVETLSRVARQHLLLEPGLLEKDLWGDKWDLFEGTLCQSITGYIGGSFDSVLKAFTDCNYYDLGSKVEYYYEEGKVHLCSIETAKKRWLDWHENHRISGKSSDKDK